MDSFIGVIDRRTMTPMILGRQNLHTALWTPLTLHFGETWPKNTFTVKNPAAVLEFGKSFGNDFHVFAINWRADRIQWFVDGDQVWEQDASVWCRPGTTNAPFDRRFHLLLNLAVGGGLPGNPDHTTKFPARMEVDWVRVYE